MRHNTIKNFIWYISIFIIDAGIAFGFFWFGTDKIPITPSIVLSLIIGLLGIAMFRYLDKMEQRNE